MQMLEHTDRLHAATLYRLVDFPIKREAFLGVRAPRPMRTGEDGRSHNCGKGDCVCVRHNMKRRNMYAKQDEDEECSDSR